MLADDNPFWQFSLAIYAEPDVAAECLALQDALGLDVNALLFCAWLGAAHRIAISDEDIAAIDTSIATWRDVVVRPLRAVRQSMKPMPAMADDVVKELRSDIARAELRSEQIEQAMLFGLTETFIAGAPANSAAEAITHNVTHFIRRHRATETPRAPNLIAAAVAYASR